jgi:hypothetical protein
VEILIGILLFLGAIAAPAIWQANEERKAYEQERQMYGDIPFAVESPMPEPAWTETAEPLFNNTFSVQADPVQQNFVVEPSLDELQQIHRLMAMAKVSDSQFNADIRGRSAAENISYLKEVCSKANPDQIKAWLAEAGFPNETVPPVRVEPGELRTLLRAFYLIRMAYKDGFIKSIVYQDMLGLSRGGNKAYQNFEVVWKFIEENEL